MEYTKGEWKAYKDPASKEIFIDVKHTVKERNPNVPYSEIAVVLFRDGEEIANANLIAAAPLGHDLAEFVSRISATWIDEGLSGIGEGDYIRMKQLALQFLAKAEGKL